MTSQTELSTDFVIAAQSCVDVLPEGIGSQQRFHIAQDEHAVLGPRQSHTDAILNLEKTNHISNIIAHQRQNDNVVLVALVIVNCSHVDAIQRAQTVIDAPLFAQLTQLGRISHQYRDPERIHPLLTQIMSQSQCHAHFVRIEVTAVTWEK